MSPPNTTVKNVMLINDAEMFFFRQIKQHACTVWYNIVNVVFKNAHTSIFCKIPFLVVVVVGGGGGGCVLIMSLTSVTQGQGFKPGLCHFDFRV